MAWSGFPVSQGDWITADLWNQIIAAINERDAETYKGGNLPPVAAGDWITSADYLAARYRIEALIPYFHNVDDGGAGEWWTKTACLTAAIGAADWTYSANAGDWIRKEHFNELRLVLDKLMWLSIAHGSISGEAYEDTSDYHTTWAAAWGQAKTRAAAQGWWLYPLGPGVSDNMHRRLATGRHQARLYYSRSTDIPFVIPNYAVDVSAAKMYVETEAENGGGAPENSVSMNIYDQANFGGTSDGFTIDANESFLVSLTNAPTKGATAHYSMRTNPAALTDDDYEPANDPGVPGLLYTRYYVKSGELAFLVKLNFAYQ